jgi:peptidoglycan hydrolase-like amidase
MSKWFNGHISRGLTRYLVIFLIFTFLLLSSILLAGRFSPPTKAKECNEGDPTLQQICLDLNELQKQLQMSVAATQPLEEELNKLEGQIKKIQAAIDVANNKINLLEKSIFDREVKLEYQKEILAVRVRSYYKKSRQYSPFLLFLASSSANDLFRELAYRQATTEEDKKVIISISQDLLKLKNDKETLEKNKVSLASAQKNLDQQAEFFRKEVAKAKTYQAQISSKIAELTAKQQALLAEKTGTFQTTVGDVPLADDPNSRPDFNPGFSPAFAAFSFGAPHRKGMSQYGAFGRAKAGQSAEEILKAYYGSGIEIKKDYSSSININVQGYGTVDIETYTKRIYEMPSSWGDEGGMEALKAQAVAARSYALAYTNNGAGSICATESCQVYKPTNKGGKWEEAVNATRGWVLMAGGQPFSAWYASTAGGYIYSYTSQGYSTPGLWDTSCGSQSCWTAEAWEKKAGSPWFYKGWYKTRDGQTCGRSHPWLTQEEMADILNAIIVYRSGQGAEHILPVDYNSCLGKGGEPWSMDQMRQEANKRGGAITSISGVSVSYSGSGQTASLVFATNQGNFQVSGEEFYTVFNLRAPGRIALKSKLFNIEKK